MNVGGWGQNQYWLSTSASNGQLALAWAVAEYADLTEVEDLNGRPGAQVAAIGKMLDNRNLVQRDLPGAVEDGRQGESPGDLGPGSRLSRIPPQLIGARHGEVLHQTRLSFRQPRRRCGRRGCTQHSVPCGPATGPGPPPEPRRLESRGGHRRRNQRDGAAKPKADRTLVLCTLLRRQRRSQHRDSLRELRLPAAARPHRHTAGSQAQPLGSVDGFKLGLHPSLVGLKTLWDAGQVAIVLGTGYPNPNYSHFQSMEIMQSADPTGDSPSGWIGRWLDATGVGPAARPLRRPERSRRSSPATANRPPPSPTAPTPAPSSPTGTRISSPPTAELEHVYQARSRPSRRRSPRPGTNLLVVGAKAASAARARSRRRRAVSPNDAGDIGNQLDIIAELIKAGLPTKAYGVMLGSFDTHTDQLQTQAETALPARRRRPELHGRLPGRLARPEPGHRDLQRVRPACAGERERRHRPRLGEQRHRRRTVGQRRLLRRAAEPARLDDTGNLVHTVDFRRVYATVLADVMGVEPRSFLGGHRYAPLPFFH